ncbi:MAG TPA: aldo/keto reductase [Thermodesulfobium narugense]|nr:aldo/keto reductase [Thermodesulfobium narugense]
MEYRKLGTSNIMISTIGLGTWAIGGWSWGGTDVERAIETIKAFIDNGGNFIDTAPAYGLGLSEEIVGEAIKGKRDKVVLATKCGLVWDTEKGTFFFQENDKPVYRYLGKESIENELNQSLRRLNTDYIDLYQIHWLDRITPAEEVMGTLLKAKEEGKIREIGICNAGTLEIEEFMKYAKIQSDQEKFSMLDMEARFENIPYCVKNNISFIAYSPLEKGLLSGKVTLDRVFPKDDNRSFESRFSPQIRGKILNILAEFNRLKEKYNITTAQLILAWTRMMPGVSCLLVGARRAEQVIENLKSSDIFLEQSDWNYIFDYVERKAESIF